MSDIPSVDNKVLQPICIGDLEAIILLIFPKVIFLFLKVKSEKYRKFHC